MSRWFRFYGEAINDPKVLRLSDTMFRAWVTLLCIASGNDGNLPPSGDIALMLRVKVQKVAEWLTLLTTAGLLDCGSDGAFRPHNWDVRQYKSDVSNDRVKRFRERQRNVTSTVSVTPPESEQKQITETDQKKETRARALADGWPPDFREQFWSKYPNKVGKPKALAKLEGCMRRGIRFDEIMLGLDRYIAAKPTDRSWLNPETFINQERWADQPANVNGRRTVHQAADDLIAKLQAFDEPAPPRLCDGEGEDAVRLLPPH